MKQHTSPQHLGHWMGATPRQGTGTHDRDWFTRNGPMTRSPQPVHGVTTPKSDEPVSSCIESPCGGVPSSIATMRPPANASPESGKEPFAFIFACRSKGTVTGVPLTVV